MENRLSYSLKNLVDVVYKKIWIVFVITILFTALTGIFSFFIIVPTYEVNTSIIIGKNLEGNNIITEYDEVLLYEKIISTYCEIAQSRLVAEKTINLLGKGISPENLLKEIKVESKTDTQVITIKYIRKDPVEAMNTVNTFASVFIEEAKELLPAGSAKIMDKALIPREPIKPTPKLYMIIAFTAGIVISIGLIFIADFMDNTLKAEEDIEIYSGLPLLGVIPRQSK